MNRRFFLITILLLSATLALAKEKGAPPMTAGAPDDRSCNNSKCHAGSDINSGNAAITFRGLPEVLTAGEVYELSLKLEQKGARSFGFQVTVVNESGDPTGKLMASDDGLTQLVDPARYADYSQRQYLTHTKSGAKSAKKGVSQEWTFTWQAPDSIKSIPSFYLAMNAADGNKKKTGDAIYARQFDIGSPK